MTTWKSDELNKIGTAEELQIASLRQDGTLRNPVTTHSPRQAMAAATRAARVRVRISAPANRNATPDQSALRFQPA